MIVANILQPLIDAAEWVILLFHDDVGLGWGWSIVALTFTTRLAILPLSVTQIRSMRALQALAPQIKELQERYKDDKQRQQREMIAFYQENKINPLASCFPLLLQLPVFLALYQLLQRRRFQRTYDERPAGQLLLHQRPDREARPAAALVALIILFIVTQLGAGPVDGRASAEGTQRIIMFVLPFVFAPFVITFPAGLAVYWISTNVWTLGQQRRASSVLPAAAGPRPVEEIEATPSRRRRRRARRRSGAERSTPCFHRSPAVQVLPAGSVESRRGGEAIPAEPAERVRAILERVVDALELDATVEVTEDERQITGRSTARTSAA